MELLHELQRLAPARIRREYAIRFRLLRSRLSLRSMRAERRADVLLISYPKCGRTWLTILLSRALAMHAGVAEEQVDYLTTDLLDGRTERLPRVRISPDDNPHWKTARGLTRSKRRYRDKKVILLVRDPRDLVVSTYFERSRREGAYWGTLSEFLRERRGSLETILAYYNIWAEQRVHLPEFHLVRYEDLRADTSGELQAILAFIGLDEVTDSLVDDAVAFASFESLRSLELWHPGAGDPGDGESFSASREKAGRYRNYLSPEDVAWIEEKVRRTLDPSFGYSAPAVRQAGSAPVPAGAAGS